MENSRSGAMQLIECPRDAMQGWKHIIPTEKKIEYLDALLQVGFDTIDFGSFVSAKAIPQMADTHEVINSIQKKNSSSKLLAIVANVRGAEEALQYEAIDYLGFPFSISPTFQLRNTNKTMEQSLEEVKIMQQLCTSHYRQLVIYISMGFGNPYGDAYDKDVVIRWTEEMVSLGINIISLADTIGVAEPSTIRYLFDHLLPTFPDIIFGAHFHSLPHNRNEKIQAAYESGCRRFDSAINGIGGCPMAKDELVGNMATENIIAFCDQNNIPLSIDRKAFLHAQQLAGKLFV